MYIEVIYLFRPASCCSPDSKVILPFTQPLTPQFRPKLGVLDIRCVTANENTTQHVHAERRLSTPSRFVWGWAPGSLPPRIRVYSCFCSGMYCIFGGPQHHVHLVRRPAPRSFSLSQVNLRLSGLRPRRRCGLITGVGSRQRRVLPCDEGAPSSSPPAKVRPRHRHRAPDDIVFCILYLR